MMLIKLILLALVCSVPYVQSKSLNEFEDKVKNSNRIMGGRPAKSGEFRGQVSLQGIGLGHVCGGILIDPIHILTTAHCHQKPKAIAYAVGDDLMVDQNFMHPEPKRQIKKVEYFVPHPFYSTETSQHDIAVIRLYKPFTVTNTFGPMRRSESTPAVGTRCTVVGWGATSYDPYFEDDSDEKAKNEENLEDRSGEQSSGEHKIVYFHELQEQEHQKWPPKSQEYSNKLLKTDIFVVDMDFCNSSYSYRGELKAGMFCAGRTKGGGHDACQGDSGGLLTCGDKNEISGITAVGNSCGLPSFPGIYVDVSAYKDWINEVMSAKELPEYEYSPFKWDTVHSEESQENEHGDHDDDDDVDDVDDDDGHSDAITHNIASIAILFSIILTNLPH